MSLKEGARVAVETCMNVREHDRVVIVCDEDTERIGMALRKAAREHTPHVRFFKLEVYGDRPIKHFPEAIKSAGKEATVGFWTARAYEGELEHIRGPFIDSVLVGGRHAHLVNVTEKVFENGMTADYTQIKKFTDKLHKMLVDVDEIRVKNEQGTDITVKFSDTIKWVPSSGICHEPGHWLNLPDGEIYTAPASIEGRVVADGVIGDYLGHKYHHKDLLETPITIDIETDDRPKYTNIHTDNEELLEDLKDYLDRHPCTKYFGEFGLGTNLYLKELIDNMLQDEKFPGVHLAFGDPMAGETGASWTCPEHMDLILTHCDVLLDGKKVMEDGEYLIHP